MTEIELGVKRRCISCGTKFYDFLKAPIICPNCNTEFDPEQLLKSRKGRVSSKSAVIEAVKKEKDEEDGKYKFIPVLLDFGLTKHVPSLKLRL